MIEIKILGTGCAKCNRLEQLTRDAVAETGVEANIAHVTDINQIFEYPIAITPALVINKAVKSSGGLPRKAQIVEWLTAAG
jgi:small redox-active disulfide protein 2